MISSVSAARTLFVAAVARMSNEEPTSSSLRSAGPTNLHGSQDLEVHRLQLPIQRHFRHAPCPASNRQAPRAAATSAQPTSKRTALTTLSLPAASSRFANIFWRLPSASMAPGASPTASPIARAAALALFIPRYTCHLPQRCPDNGGLAYRAMGLALGLGVSRVWKGYLRLKAEGLSKRPIAASLGITTTAVVECLQRVRRACGRSRPGSTTRRWSGSFISHHHRKRCNGRCRTGHSC
jgi:hypothetical protein